MRIVPSVRLLLAIAPTATSDHLDRLHPDIPLFTYRKETLRHISITRIPRRRWVQRKHHRIEIETFQRFENRLRNLWTVPGYSKPFRQPLLPHLYQRLKRTTRSGRQLQLLHISYRMKLKQVEVLDIHPLHNALDIPPSTVSITNRGLRTNENPSLANLRHPRRHPFHRVPIGRRDVEMVHPSIQNQLNRRVCRILVHISHRVRSERNDRAVVTRPPKGSFLH